MKMIFSKLQILLLSLSSIANCEKPKIAIIGAGIGGTSCAYFLRSYLNNSVTIDVYEGGQIGGRLATTEYKNVMFETGGAVIHERNQYMQSFFNKFNFQEETKFNKNPYFGIYDKNGFHFKSSEWKFVTILKIIMQYGFSFRHLMTFTDKMLDEFDNIYKLQDQGESFSTLEGMMFAIDEMFLSYLNVTAEKGFVDLGLVSEDVIHDFVKGTLRVNYGQSVDVPLFVACVSVVGMFGKLWSVKGGNKQIPESLLAYSKAKLIKEMVTDVRRAEADFVVTSYLKNDSRAFKQRQYDYVIVAKPLTTDCRNPISFTNCSQPIVPGSYRRTVATLVSGRLKSQFFHTSDQFDFVIVNDQDSILNSVALLAKGVWKIFSRRPLTDSELNLLFEDRGPSKVFDWLAYPDYTSAKFQSRSFVLADRLYYVNAVEWAASAMEMSAIGGRNVALLICNELSKTILSARCKKGLQQIKDEL